MAKSVETRVVEMRFDNKSFEKGAKETMGTLAKLKGALNFTKSTEAINNLKEAASNIDISPIAKSLQALEDRFSTMGIVGMTIIQNLTNAMINTLGKGINFVTDAIVSGGIRRAMNIENAHFQLQALLKDEARVQAVMDNAMESVDGTAYAYDEAAKAASQFSASGIEAGEDMLNALKGITGVAAMTNSEFESISMIFTTVAGNGRLMGDQLLQLSSRGLNAASTIADYFREVRGEAGMTESTIREMVSDGQISFRDFSDAMTWAFGDSAKRANETFNGAMSNMKSAFARIGAGFVSPLVEQNGELVNLFNALRIQINNVKSALVFDEQTSAISGLSKVVKLSTDDIKSLFGQIKKEGKLSSDILDQFTTHGADALGALTNYINGVSNGTQRASYAISTSVKEMTGGVEISSDEVRNFVESGKIDLAIFTSAMETTFGDQRALTKQFTDFFLDNVSKLVKAIESTDLTKPMEGFYYILEAVKNVFKGLWSIVSPLGGAFKDVFLSFSGQDFVDFTASLEEFTSKLTLTERGSKNLHDTFEGLFSVVKLVMDVIFKLVGATTHTIGPITSMAELVLSLTGALGRALTAITKFIGQSKLLNGALKLINKTVKILMTAIKKIVLFVYDLTESMFGILPIEKILNTVSKAFEKFGNFSAPYINVLIDKLKELRAWAIDLFPDKAEKASNAFVKAMKAIWRELRDFDLSSPSKWLEILKDKIQDLVDLINSNKGFATFVKNAKEFGIRVNDAFTFDHIIDNLKKFKDALFSFAEWIGNKLGPMFKNFSIGDAIGIAGSIGMIKVLYDIGKKLGGLVDKIGEVTGVFDKIKGVLSAYQKDLKANYILKIAAAIAILAAALVLLTFADTDKMLSAAAALTTIGTLLVGGVGVLMLATEKGKTMQKALANFTNGLAKSMENLTAALKWKTVGSIIKSIGETILMISLSIVAIGLLYKKDANAFKVAAIAVGAIGVALVAVVGIMTLITRSSKNARGMISASASLIAVCISLGLVISSLNKLMKIKLPNDYGEKFLILTFIMAELAGLTIVVAAASRIAGGKKFKASSFLSLAFMLNVTISALKKLFKIDLPDDWRMKIDILQDVFRRVEELLLVLAIASKISGKTMKAGGTMLAMAVFIGVIVAALAVLAIFPGDKIRKGAEALGVVLMTLGIALAGAGKISNGSNSKTVLAMAITIGAIAAALGILSIMDFDKIFSSAIILGALLIAIATDFKAIGSISDSKSLPTIISMILVMAEIAGILYLLSSQPWDAMLGAGLGMASVITAIGICFKLLKSSSPDLKSIGVFLIGTSALLPVAGILYLLSSQPWDAMLGAAGSLSTVILSFSGALTLLSKFNIGIGEAIKAAGALDAFITLIVLPLGALAVLLGELFGDSDLSSLESGLKIMSMVCYGLGEALGSLIGGAIEGILSFIPALGEMINDFWENIKPFTNEVGELPASVFTNMLALSGALMAFGVAELVSGLGSLIAGGALSAVGTELSDFMTNAMPFFEALNIIDPNIVESAKNIASMIVSLTVAELLQGVTEFLGMSGSLSAFGEELKDFGPAIKDFAEEVDGIDAEAVKGAAAACDIMSTAAKNLPGTDGLVQKLFGEKSLAEFGKELVSFGPAIVDFSDLVKDIDPEAVKGAAAACDIMSTAAKNLPGQGGLAQKIFGSHSLSEFGKELVAFGPAIVDFSDLVKDINSSAVQGAADACSIMSTVANELPEEASVKSFFTGKPKDLDDFGEELVILGEAIMGFAEEVDGINSRAVSAASSAIDVMATVAEKMPEGSSVWSFLAGGKSKDLDDFGEELEKLGPHIAEFAYDVKDIRTSAVDGATKVAEMMVTLAENLPSNEDVGDKTGLESFGKELAAFGPDINKFSKCVKNIQPESVQGAASAAKIMSECAKNLPGTDGLVQKLFGKKSLKDFGIELTSFGPHIKHFSEQVAGLDPTAVQGAASAAKIMSECANNLPLANGFAQKLFGVKSLKDFGKELVLFGPSIKTFSNDVKGMDVLAVQGAASAAKLMAALANDLPSANGFAQKLFGEKSLKDFGKELKEFGPYISSFSKSVIDVNPQSVSAAAQSASIMNEFSKSLEKSGGLKSVFEGEAKLTAFGKDLAGFASGFRTFYLQIEDVDTLQINKAIYEFGSLVNLAQYVEDVNSEALSDFIEAINDVGQMGINKFIQEFANSGIRVTSAIEDFLNHGARVITNQHSIITDKCYELGQSICDEMKDGLTNRQQFLLTTVRVLAEMVNAGFVRNILPGKYFELGQKVVRGLAQGMGDQLIIVRSKVITICSDINNTFVNSLLYSTYYRKGSDIINWIKEGMQSELETTISNIIAICSAIVWAFQNNLKASTFNDLGRNTMRGFVDGVNGNALEVTTAMQLVAGKALAAIQEKLEIHSPSEATYEMGQFVAQGLTNGLISEMYRIRNSSTAVSEQLLEVINATVQGVANSIDNNQDFEPNIRPVLDLTNVKSGIQQANGLFNENLDLLVLYRDAVGAISQPENQNEEFTINVDNNKVVDAINGLNDKFDQLADAISDIQIRLDSGTLVGELISDIDNSLGHRAKMRGRGV